MQEDRTDEKKQVNFWRIIIGSVPLYEVESFKDACVKAATELGAVIKHNGGPIEDIIFGFITSTSWIEFIGDNSNFIHLGNAFMIAHEEGWLPDPPGVVTPEASDRWTSVNLMRDRVQVGTFKAACKNMFEVLNDIVDKGGVAEQILETGIWIEKTGHPSQPIMFYDAKDIAAEIGWIIDGKWVE